MRVAEGADRRDVDDLRGLGLERRLEHPLGAEHVGLVHRAVLAGGNPDLVDRRVVDHRIAALEPGGDRGAVGEVADDQLAAERFELATPGEVADEHPHVVASLA